VVQVTAVEYHYTLSRTTVPAGKVILEFINRGQDEHNLNVQPSTGTSAAAFPTVTPGTVTKLEVELRPGTYTLFCSLPGHEAKGMKASLTVE
jgi:plastocyanin